MKAHARTERVHPSPSNHNIYSRRKHPRHSSPCDRFQESSRSIVESPILYVLLLILVLGFVLRRFYVVYNGRAKSRAYVSAKAKEWGKKLNAAERMLARFGYRREPGETVGAFERRVKIALSSLTESQVALKKFQKARQALLTLDEYESNRWGETR